jgi:predicted 2-oxoglutarate/Fe(II)-dependent dioxygenase YbiX
MSEQREIANNHPRERFSITPSGFFGEGKENIVELENFMTEEELVLLNHFAKNNKEWDYTETKYNEQGVIIYDASYWEDRVISYSNLWKVNQKIAKMVDAMQERLKIEVDKFFNVDAIATGPSIVKWKVGNKQLPHADKELHKYKEWGGGPDKEGVPNDFPHYDIAGLFYINDDYEGGELYFPEQGIQFKPKAGAAYFFPGDKNYIHGVTEITSGTRYTCPFFFTILKHNEEDKLLNWNRRQTFSIPHYDVLYPKVVVYRDAFPNVSDFVNKLKKYDQWEKWYDVGKQIHFGKKFHHMFENFPSLEEWDNAHKNYQESIVEIQPETKIIEDLFYFLTKDYLDKFPMTLDNWIRAGGDILCYEAKPEDFVTKEASGNANLALPFHTDFHQPKGDEPGIKPGITVTMYLNDDHEGGEISYRIFEGKDTEHVIEGTKLIPTIPYDKPIDEFTYKPKAGDIIIFPSNIPFYHGVHKVTKGFKYFVRTFWMYNKK